MKSKKKFAEKKRTAKSGRIHSMVKTIKNVFGVIKKTLTPDAIAWKSASVGIIAVVLVFLLILWILYAFKLGILISGIMLLYLLTTGIAAASFLLAENFSI
jgi:hypothetical protein